MSNLDVFKLLRQVFTRTKNKSEEEFDVKRREDGRNTYIYTF